jgi:limonene-1,2-epoxide hydrolase
MTPKQIVKNWVEAFNKKDVEALADLYTNDAINHQVNTEPLHGRASIKKMFVEEFAKAEMVCIVENIFEDSNWAILEWKDPLGLRGCGFFEIENDKIKFQRGYWDRLTFLRMHNLPIPQN